MAKKDKKDDSFIAENRKARHDYTITDTVEAGIMLMGSEVKSMRMQGGVSIMEAHAGPKQGDIYLFNANIPEYKMSNRFNHEPKRPRKLLLRKREIDKLSAAIQRQGMTLIPLKLYFNERGIVKLLLGIAAGRKKADKRAAEKEKDWKRQKERALKHG